MRRYPAKHQTKLRLYLEALEPRALMSASLPGINLRRPVRTPIAGIEHMTLAWSHQKGISPLASAAPGTNWLTPAEIRHAYGMDQVTFGSLTGDGAGQTIAIIVAYHSPTLFADLQAFDQFFGLSNLSLYTGSGMTTPYFRQVAQDGSTNFPATDTAGPGGVTGKISWEMEAAMDVQYAHAMAPAANILLVEANSVDPGNLNSAAANWARAQPGVSVVSMSYGSSEFFGQSGLYDSIFTTPPGHTGVTFVASTGDLGSPPEYPATSVNVVGVGATTLSLDASGNYGSEAAWVSTGGGPSGQIAKPAFQAGITLGGGNRVAPDVALDGDPGTGVAVFDSWDFPGNSWLQIGGTSLSAPMFAGMIAVANQGRNYLGLGNLDGPSGTLPALYALPAADFHDVVNGGNGTYSAGPGYDMVTGLGTPVAKKMITDLAGVAGSISGRAYADNNGDGVFDAGDVAQAGVPVYLDANGNGVLDTGGTFTRSSGAINTKITDNSTVGIASSLTVTGLGGLITSISVNFTITHPKDSNLSAYLIGPDGTEIALFPQILTSSGNFTNTTLVDSSSRSITAGVPPFTGTYQPSGLLSTFNGKVASGVWKLEVTDTVSGSTGSLNSWSITITTGPEKSTLTAADGSYSFNSVLGGPYTVREVTPAGFTQTPPANANFNIAGPTAGVDFVNLQTTFTAAGTSNSFYLWQSQGKLNVGRASGVPAYQMAAATAPALKFNLSTAGSALTVDFAGGLPIPAQNILVNGSGIADSQIIILGSNSTLTMTDTQIAAATGAINYSGLGALTLRNSIVNYTGNLSTLNNLVVDTGTIFYWN